jgi:Ser/Thr protein kinase RdoA (MazF antagonist)
MVRNEIVPQGVLSAYGFDAGTIVEAFGSGLIHRTWKVTSGSKEYILQRVNHEVFKDPFAIAHNIRMISDHIDQHHPEYFFIRPLVSEDGDDLIYLEEEGYFRLFPFAAGSHTFDIVESPAQAYEAARQFGKFTRMLEGIDLNRLRITIPYFHDLGFRYQEFRNALTDGNAARIRESKQVTEQLLKHEYIVEQYKNICNDDAFLLRVTHHDTKISNVLFDKNEKGMAVIDLDTVMPGYFISDVGDMMRSYLSPVNEEEKDVSKITVREDFYRAIVRGYRDEMKSVLTAKEDGYFFYSAIFMVYMQALRFLTDHFNNDVYYGARYEGHNLVRARNQAILLEEIIKKKEVLKAI